jgi:tRNA A-37 threonylcarbamoyl transferase component Bud32
VPERTPIAVASSGELFRRYLHARETGQRVELASLFGEAGPGADELRRRVETYEALRELSEDMRSPEERGEPAELGRFRVRHRLGSGGLAQVYRAYDPQLGRDVALKVLDHHPAVQQEERRWVLNEARSLARLDHPCVVRVFEVGVADGRDFIAMELVEGPTLADVLFELRAQIDGVAPDPDEDLLETELDRARRERARELAGELLPFSARASLALRLARALAYCHDCGVLHRDVKPTNVLMDGAGRPKLIDFGLAHLDSEQSSGIELTQRLIGAPAYVAPEQVEENRIGADPLSDVFQLGTTLYELLALENPFQRATRSATLDAVSRAMPRSPARVRSSVPRDLCRVALHCLERRPDDRYPSMAAIAEDLDAFLHGRAISLGGLGVRDALVRWARRNGRTVLAAAALVFVLLSTWLAIAVQHVRGDRADVRLQIEQIALQDLDEPAEFLTAADALEQVRALARRSDASLLAAALGAPLVDEVDSRLRAFSLRLAAAIGADEERCRRTGAPFPTGAWKKAVFAEERLCPGETAVARFRERGRLILPAELDESSVVLQQYSAIAGLQVREPVLDHYRADLAQGRYRLLRLDERRRPVAAYEFTLESEWDPPRQPLLEPPDPGFLREFVDVPAAEIHCVDFVSGSPEEVAFTAQVPSLRILPRLVRWGDVTPFLESSPDAEVRARLSQLDPEAPAALPWRIVEAYAQWRGAHVPSQLELLSAFRSGAISRPDAPDLAGEWTGTPSRIGLGGRLVVKYSPSLDGIADAEPLVLRVGVTEQPNAASGIGGPEGGRDVVFRLAFPAFEPVVLPGEALPPR